MRNSGRPNSLPPAAYTIAVDVVQALVVERDLLKGQMQERDREIRELRTQLRKPATSQDTDAHDAVLSARSETTYLHIIGGLVDVLLRQSPAGQHYSIFTSQDAIINTVVAFHGNKLGISKRTLEQKFASARRTLTET